MDETSNDWVRCLTSQMKHLMDNGKMKEAMDINLLLLDYLCFVAFTNYSYDNRSTETLRLFYINSTACSLNTNNLNLAEQSIRNFERISNNTIIPNDLILEHLDCKIELFLRRGNYKGAEKVVIEALNYVTTDEERCKFLINAGKVDNEDRLRDEFRINKLSDALFLAEKIGDMKLQAEVYQHLSGMFKTRYMYLAINFIRKAEVIYEKLGDRGNMDLCRLNRCAMYYSIGTENNGLIAELKDETIRILNEVDISRIPSPHASLFYAYLVACMKSDLHKLIWVCREYQRMGVHEEVCRTADRILEISYSKGMYDVTRKYIDIFLDANKKTNKKTKINAMEHVLGLKKMLDEYQHVDKRADREITDNA